MTYSEYADGIGNSNARKRTPLANFSPFQRRSSAGREWRGAPPGGWVSMRIRTIKPEFWLHPVMSRKPAETRLLALALLNYADDEGYFYADAELVRGAVMPREDSGKIHGMLRELSSGGDDAWIDLCQNPTFGTIGRVRTFKQHQAISHPKPSKIKPHWFHESSGKAPVMLPTSSGQEQGTGNREQDNTPQPPNGAGRFPATEEEAFSCIPLAAGYPRDFIVKTWQQAMARGGKDAHQCPIANWVHHLAVSWKYERERGSKPGRSGAGTAWAINQKIEGLKAKLKKAESQGVLTQEEENVVQDIKREIQDAELAKANIPIC